MFHFPPLTPMIRSLMIVNIVIFLSQQFNPFVNQYGALSFVDVIEKGYYWQVVSYSFLHGGLGHLFFNMLSLYFIGGVLENEWGSRRFLLYYVLSAVISGIFILLVQFITVQMTADTTKFFTRTIGASASLFSILLAYSLKYKDRNISLLVFFVIPVTIPARYLVWIILLLSFLFGNTNVSHSGHIGGVIAGFILFIILRKQYGFEEGNDVIFSFKKFFKGNVGKQNYTYQQKNSYNKKSSGGLDSFFKQFRQISLDETKMTDEEVEEQIDNLLEIISIKGIGGLTTKEKIFLERVSKKYKHKFPDND